MRGFLLVDHGSRKARSHGQLLDMADRVRRLVPTAPVVACHMEIESPDIAAGVAELVAAGVREIVVLPYFLSDGRHLSEDIPALVAAAVAGHPGLVSRIGGALGPHDLLARILLERAGLAPDEVP